MAWSDHISWDTFPEHLRYGLKHYVEHGRIPGDLLVGILSNELDKCVDSAKGELFAQVPQILAFIRVYVPQHCYGTGERMAFWERVGGQKGLEEIAHYGTKGDDFP